MTFPEFDARMTATCGPYWRTRFTAALGMGRQAAHEWKTRGQAPGYAVALLEFLETCPKRRLPARWKPVLGSESRS